MYQRQKAYSKAVGYSSVFEPERFTPMIPSGFAPSASSREDSPEVPGYGVLLPESFAGASSLSHQLAPSVPHQSGLSPASYGGVFNCQSLYTVLNRLARLQPGLVRSFRSPPCFRAGDPTTSLFAHRVFITSSKNAWKPTSKQRKVIITWKTWEPHPQSKVGHLPMGLHTQTPVLPG